MAGARRLGEERQLYAVNAVYQGALAVAGFWYGSALCRMLAVNVISSGPFYQAMEETIAALRQHMTPARLAELPVIVLAYPAPFILAVGLLPRQRQAYLTSDLIENLGVYGRRFLLARVWLHGRWPQRLAVLLPVLALTVILADMPSSVRDWLVLIGFLAGWLVLHWLFELHVDRQAAQAIGEGATQGLQEMLAATAPPVAGLTVHPQIRWRLRAVAGQ